MKNFLIRAFLFFCKPFIKTNTGERFLVVSTTGLGDTLWGTPAIRALRESFPKAYIAVLTSRMGKEILQNNPHIDEIFVVKTSSLLTLLRRKIGTVLVFHTSQRAVLPFCALLGAGRIIGTEHINKGLDFLLTDRLEQTKIHEIERRLNIVSKIISRAGCKIESRLMEFFPSSADQVKAASLMPAGCVIGIHPGAKDRFKQWPPSHFIELGKRLQKKLNCRIVVTGTPAEKQLVSSIAAAIEGAIPIYEGVSIPTLAAIVEKLSLYITNDTGPLHIACTTKTPTIALFTPTDPLLCGPYFTSHVKVIQRKPTCFPCLRKKCQDAFCMQQIGPDEVYKTAIDWVRK